MDTKKIYTLVSVNRFPPKHAISTTSNDTTAGKNETSPASIATVAAADNDAHSIDSTHVSMSIWLL